MKFRNKLAGALAGTAAVVAGNAAAAPRGRHDRDHRDHRRADADRCDRPGRARPAGRHQDVQVDSSRDVRGSGMDVSSVLAQLQDVAVPVAAVGIAVLGVKVSAKVWAWASRSLD